MGLETWGKLSFGCCLFSYCYIITTEKTVKQLSEHCNILHALITATQTRTQWHFLFPTFLPISAWVFTSHKKENFLFHSRGLSSLLPLWVITTVSVPMSNQFFYGLQSTELPATMITACSCFRCLFAGLWQHKQNAQSAAWARLLYFI